MIIDLLKQAGIKILLIRQNAKERKDNEDNSKKAKKQNKQKNVLPVQTQFVLDLEITEGGKNLSSGEKQLICICRAILRQNKIIVLDEATANIDLVTEQKIQALIAKEFKHCTVITIAHRLQTIIESDMVLVLGEGRVLEYDTPQNLMFNKESQFTMLVNELKKEE